jgi:hypothetical protein
MELIVFRNIGIKHNNNSNTFFDYNNINNNNNYKDSNSSVKDFLCQPLGRCLEDNRRPAFDGKRKKKNNFFQTTKTNFIIKDKKF